MQSGSSLEEDSHKKAITLIDYILNTVLFKFDRKSSVVRRNTFFTWLKSFGGVPVAMIIFREDLREGWENDDLLKVMFPDVSMGTLPPDQWKSAPVFSFLLECGTPLLSELTILDKMFGYPFIDIDAGLEKLYTRTHADINPDYHHVFEEVGVRVT